ncbi:hypothetical protein CBS101457_003161 [Exobasidium rhododendri]|nr:hypothetical protein CBS101457_003161 [Exobasidium rhododendri]
MADKLAWVESLRTIFHLCSRLETTFIATRPGGEALQEFIRHANTPQEVLPSLKRVTISSLSFSFPNLGVGSLEAPNLTHLHLIQWVPPTLSERFGSTLYKSLQCLRLSRISSYAIQLPSMNLGTTSSSNGSSAQEMFDRSISTSVQPLLLLLRECVEQYTSLRTICLEMMDLGDLDMPEHLTPWQDDQERRNAGASVAGSDAAVVAAAAEVLPSTGGFGAPFDQFSTGQLGQLATLDFPADVPLTSEEGLEWAERQEESRCGSRLAYWQLLEQFKNLLLRYSQEARADVSNSNVHYSDGAHRYSHSSFSPVDIRIVAPRSLGWDRNESILDFHSNASACQGEPDLSAFEDEDVFELVQKYPHLGYDYGIDSTGKRVAYWTGALPRFTPIPTTLTD